MPETPLPSLPTLPPAIDGFNLIVFAIQSDSGNGPRLFLSMDRPFDFLPGIEPCVLTATVDKDQYAQLAGNAVGRKGTVEFWFTSVPSGAYGSFDPAGVGTAPDLTFENMQIVEVESELAAFEDQGTAGDNPQYRTIIYRLHLADRRRDFAYPRGGVLDGGEYNKTPLAANGIKDANQRTTITTKQAVELCLKAMGIDSEVTVPPEVSDYPRPMDLQWRGNHAPGELADLLREINFILILSTAGKFSMERIGTGATPTIETDRKILSVPKSWGGLDRRSKAVLFCSHPNPILDTITVTGPGADIEFVIPEGGNWVRLVTAADFNDGRTPAERIRGGYLVDRTGDQTLRRTIYRAIRLVPAKYGPGPVLRELRYSSSVVDEITVTAPTAKTDETGLLWANAGPTRLTVEQLLGHGTVMLLSEAVGKLEMEDGQSYVINPDAAFQEAEDGEISLTVTREVWEKNAAGDWSPQFTYIGVIQDENSAGGLRVMTDDEVKTYKGEPGKDVSIIARPELVELRLNGSVVNKTELTTRAISVARQWIGPIEGDVDQLEGRGWFGVTMSGKVAQVEISQTPPSITYKLNTFFMPSARYLHLQREKEAKAGAGQSFPKQAETAAPRAASGASGTQPAAAPVMPLGAERVQFIRKVVLDCDLTKDGGDNGSSSTRPTWTYTVSFNGTQIAKEQSPRWGRAIGLYEEPAIGGLATIDAAGGVQLLVAFEIPQTEECLTNA